MKSEGQAKHPEGHVKFNLYCFDHFYIFNGDYLTHQIVYMPPKESNSDLLKFVRQARVCWPDEMERSV